MRNMYMLILVATSISIGASYGQSNSPAITPTDTPTTESAEVHILQAQYQLQKEYTSDILNTVYFTLGLTIAVLLTMVGFGWHQSHRVYERDKEDLEKHAAETTHKAVQQAQEDVNKRLSERLAKFDERIAKAIGTINQNLADIHVGFQADLFNTTHLEPTPRTDLMVLLNVLCHSTGRVSDEVLKHALSVVLSHIESIDNIDGVTRTSILELANTLPPALAAQASRLREVLTAKT